MEFKVKSGRIFEVWTGDKVMHVVTGNDMDVSDVGDAMDDWQSVDEVSGPWNSQ
jgi:hypothetical protein